VPISDANTYSDRNAHSNAFADAYLNTDSYADPIANTYSGSDTNTDAGARLRYGRGFDWGGWLLRDVERRFRCAQRHTHSGRQ
jgi:hypothetical protein